MKQKTKDMLYNIKNELSDIFLDLHYVPFGILGASVGCAIGYNIVTISASDVNSYQMMILLGSTGYSAGVVTGKELDEIFN